MNQQLISEAEELLVKFYNDRTQENLKNCFNYLIDEMSSSEEEKKKSYIYVQTLLYIDKKQILESISWIKWAQKMGGYEGMKELFKDEQYDIAEESFKLAENLKINLK